MLLITVHEVHGSEKRPVKWTSNYLTELTCVDFLMQLSDQYAKRLERTTYGGHFDILNVVDIGTPTQEQIMHLRLGYLDARVFPSSTGTP